MAQRPIILTVTQAAARLGISRQAMFKHVRSGKLPATLLDSVYIIFEEDFQGFVNKRLETARDQVQQLEFALAFE